MKNKNFKTVSISFILGAVAGITMLAVSGFTNGDTDQQASQTTINSNEANTLFKKGDTGTGRNLFQQAKEDIQNTRLEFLYSMLTDYESQFASYRPNQGKT